MSLPIPPLMEILKSFFLRRQKNYHCREHHNNNLAFFLSRYFNYRTTRFLAEEGFYKFHNWFDDRAWYPLGRIIGGTIYPGKEQDFESSL